MHKGEYDGKPLRRLIDGVLENAEELKGIAEKQGLRFAMTVGKKSGKAFVQIVKKDDAFIALGDSWSEIPPEEAYKLVTERKAHFAVLKGGKRKTAFVRILSHKRIFLPPETEKKPRKAKAKAS